MNLRSGFIRLIIRFFFGGWEGFCKHDNDPGVLKHVGNLDTSSATIASQVEGPFKKFVD